MINMEDFLKIGVVQTTVDSDVAWDAHKDTQIVMCDYEGDRVWNEIVKAFASIKSEPLSNLPRIVIFPEFTLPLHKQRDLGNISKKLGVVIIAGLDFVETESGIKNNAIICVPNKWIENEKSYSVKKFHFGKRFFSNEEKQYFNKKDVKGLPTPYIHLIDADKYGKIGVAICADLFDIERFVIYKGKIQHLFIIAYNKDINSFYFLAEAISRLVFCNVVICNTGHYGGSVAVSPYKESFRRSILKMEGKDLFNVQIVPLPVAPLIEAQMSDDFEMKKAEFKSRPPGYEFCMNEII